MHTHFLNPLLRPKSLAILGASEREGSFGFNLYQSIKSLGYSGKIWLVNPKYEKIYGETAYPELAAVPASIDCAAMAIADKALPQAIHSAARAGVRAAVLFGRSWGKHEDGRSLTQVLTATAAEANMTLCGSNCMGYVNLEDKLQLTGFPFSQLKESGSIGLISHSGSTWSAIVGNLRQLHFNYAISAGQELTTGVADYIDFLLSQPSTQVICLVLETVRQPENFLSALERAQKQHVPIIALKLGRSKKGQEFAKSHSGAMSGSADVYDAIFERNGVISVRSLDELMDTAELFAAKRKPHNGLIGLGCDSGGERQLIADLSEQLQLPFAELANETVQELEEIMDPGIEASNPLDYWGDGRDYIAKSLLAMAQDANVGTLVMASNIPDGQNFTQTCVTALQKVIASTHKPVVFFGNVANTMSPNVCQFFRNQGIPVLMGTETALRALKHYSSYHEEQYRNLRLPKTLSLVEVPAARVEYWQTRLHQAAQAEVSLQDFDLLKDFDIPIAPCASVTDIHSALEFARMADWPLVAKIDLPAVEHKSDMGGVILDITNDESLLQAIKKLQIMGSRNVLLQKQAKGSELILGMKRDPQFNMLFTVGFGGVFVEILKDYVTLLPHDSAALIAEKLCSLKTWPLFSGARGSKITNPENLVEVIQKFMRMGMHLQDYIEEMEINPLLADGNNFTAVDLLVIPTEKNTRRSHEYGKI